MIRFSHKMEIEEVIVCLVAVDMVDVPTLGNSLHRNPFPYCSVQQVPLAVCSGVVSTCAASVAMPFEEDKRQWLTVITQRERSTLKTLVNCLSRHAKRLGDLGQTESILVQLVHFVCRLNVWFATHIGIVSERLTGVN